MRKTICETVFVVLLFVTTLYLSGCAYMPSEKLSGDILYGTALTGLVMDWGQTRDISKHPERWGENNSILGPHPTLTQVDAYFPTMITATALSKWLVKDSYQPYVYGVITALEAYCVIHNKHGGINLDFIGINIQ